MIFAPKVTAVNTAQRSLGGISHKQDVERQGIDVVDYRERWFAAPPEPG
ncbi:hypothetical protein [Pseudomonas fluorescens]|nr:hypothetical protein [Pseudomonas fluorescens]